MQKINLVLPQLVFEGLSREFKDSLASGLQKALLCVLRPMYNREISERSIEVAWDTFPEGKNNPSLTVQIIFSTVLMGFDPDQEQILYIESNIAQELSSQDYSKTLIQDLAIWVIPIPNGYWKHYKV